MELVKFAPFSFVAMLSQWLQLLKLHSVQQKVSLYAKWFHWILSEFINHNKQWLMGK
jgi:hypothetical protein